MLEPTTPTPLAAITPRRYNSHVPAKDTNAIRLNVLFFGRLKDAIGHGQECVEIPPDSRIEDLFTHCVARYPELAAHRKAVAVSRNREFAAWTTPLQSGDEVAFLPPVSGG
ncbi:MAG: MoaD/ThiS family protein [Acidobacteria bacterium]|nr:MoaD/ThiS family protein [Acidobacteriota bacterium]